VSVRARSLYECGRLARKEKTLRLYRFALDSFLDTGHVCLLGILRSSNPVLVCVILNVLVGDISARHGTHLDISAKHIVPPPERRREAIDGSHVVEVVVVSTSPERYKVP
jgi:hypothetical protein